LVRPDSFLRINVAPDLGWCIDDYVGFKDGGLMGKGVYLSRSAGVWRDPADAMTALAACTTRRYRDSPSSYNHTKA
jgi:hypothetical protein